MWLRLKILTIVLLSFFARGSTFVENNMGRSIGVDSTQKFLCGNNFEKCFGRKLNSVVYLRNDKLYRVEVYDYKLPSTLDEIMEEQISLKTELDLLENKIEQQSEANAELFDRDLELSQKAEDDRNHIRSELTENMNGIKSTLLNTLKTKLNRMDRRIRKPLANEPNADLPASCAEAFDMYETTESGIYKLYLPSFELPPFEVYCLADPNGGPAWTLVQRRMDGSEDFYREWDDYVAGFGNQQGEFFIGLDKLYALTNDQPNELWIQLEDFEDEKRFAKYTDFAIGDLDENYALNKLDGFSGDAGDSLVEQKGSQFSTLDRDNDNDASKSCAITYNGAWWYNRCHDSNLNGLYIEGGEYDYSDVAQGIDWFSWHGHQYSMKYVHMAIRPNAVRM